MEEITSFEHMSVRERTMLLHRNNNYDQFTHLTERM